MRPWVKIEWPVEVLEPEEKEGNTTSEMKSEKRREVEEVEEQNRPIGRAKGKEYIRAVQFARSREEELK